MNVFDLFARLSLDKSEYEEGLNSAEKEANKFGSAVSSGLGVATKAIGAGITAAATGVGALTKSAVEGYADYEQLVGGVETLFGAGGQRIDEYAESVGKTVDEVRGEYYNLISSQKEVFRNASEAYKTAGLSANEYMDTVTGFSAALIASLDGDTKKAASVADRAITDMADNANKMGTSIESIQTAYSGFSKQNYTMLDNLKLGYGGTKEEMQRLIQDASEMTDVMAELGVTVDKDDMSFGNIVNAISVVQTKMGITGTTAREASETIAGSTAAMKSAWSNLVVGIADDQSDFTALIDNFVESVGIAAGNIIPRIETALNGIANLIDKLAPVIAEKLPGLIETILPPLLSAAIQIVTALANNLPMILQVLIDQLPLIIDTIINTLVALIPQLLPLGLDVILAIADGIIQSLDTLIPAIVDIIFQIVDILTEPDNILKLLDAALQIIVAIAEGLMNALPKLIEKVPVIISRLVEAIVKALPKIVEAGLNILTSIIDGILKGIPKIPAAISQVKDSVVNGVMEIVNSASTWGRDLINNFIAGIKEKWEDFKGTIADMAGTVSDYLHFSEPDVGPLSNFHTYAPDMMKLFAQGIKDNEKLITNQLDKSFDFSNNIIPNSNAIITKNDRNIGSIVKSDTSSVVVNVALEGIASEILRVVRAEAKKEFNSSGNNVVVYGG